MVVPVVIICHNNHRYVANTLSQLRALEVTDVRIMNNDSTDKQTLGYLQSLESEFKVVIYNEPNTGPWITNTSHVGVYNQLPEQFAMTDPDLQFHPKLTPSFLQHMLTLSEELQAYKIGFALDISEPDKMFPGAYFHGQTIAQWEDKFWKTRIPHDRFELYDNQIDTTFCLVNKKYLHGRSVRMAGDFLAKHLPWYPLQSVLSLREQFDLAAQQTTAFSSVATVVKAYVTDQFVTVRKNEQTILIRKRADDPNIGFWTNIYAHWEPETFRVMDKFLSKDKVFLDIGGWIGTTCIYGAAKSQRVLVVEADPGSQTDLKLNASVNCTNVTLVPLAIYHLDDEKLHFGKNTFLPGSKLNDSTSQIQEQAAGTVSVTTIRVPTLLKRYEVRNDRLALVKVDVESAEEFILDDLLDLPVPLYISFHYTWWKDKNLDRFSRLTSDQKELIRQQPFTSILFHAQL